jgi:hypothetical protein
MGTTGSNTAAHSYGIVCEPQVALLKTFNDSISYACLITGASGGNAPPGSPAYIEWHWTGYTYPAGSTGSQGAQSEPYRYNGTMKFCATQKYLQYCYNINGSQYANPGTTGVFKYGIPMLIQGNESI